MRVPLRWLKDFVDIEVSVDRLADILTMAGLEISKVEHVGQDWDRHRILVGEIREVKPHPKADRLTVVKVAYGPGKTIETVSGAPNVHVGESGGKVVLALPGASFLDPDTGGQRRVTLDPAEIRGIRSEGMICSERELGISDDHSGVLMLDEDAPVGVPLQDYLGDAVLDLDLTPNLARCLSIIGVAREVAALTNRRLRPFSQKMLNLGERDSWRYVTDVDPASATTSYIHVRIHQPELCSRYSASLLDGVTIRKSPMWMQHRLRLAGMRPINNVVDATNYCMWEWGQPLHAFDYEKIRDQEIGVRKAKPGEGLVTLDGVMRRFSAEDLLITDAHGPIAIAGVMGGLDSEVSGETRSILLESANFELTSIRRTVQTLKLPSEASLRFGKGMDPELTMPALQRANLLIRALSGASICPEIADAYPVKALEKVVHLSTGEVRRILGMDFSLKEISKILESLEFRCKKTEKRGTLAVTVPTHRLDVSIAADLIEEIARIHGYEKIPVALMADTLPPQRRNPCLEFEEKTRDTLVACGLTEVITYSMTSMESVSKLGPERKSPDPSEFIALVNPTSLDKTHMRRSLLPGMLEALSLNSRISDRIMIFEIGRIYLPHRDHELPQESRRLGIVICGPTEAPWWMNPESPMMTFFHLKGILEVLFRRIGIPACNYEEARPESLHPGKSASVRIGEMEVGFLGELHPDVRRNFELTDQTIVAAELDLDRLFWGRAERLYQPICPFPPAKEDLAVVLREEVPVQELMRVVLEAGKPLVKEAAVFDVWKGRNIPEGKKSVAFSLTYQAIDHVLEGNEIKETRNRIIERLSDALGARLRE